MSPIIEGPLETFCLLVLSCSRGLRETLIKLPWCRETSVPRTAVRLIDPELPPQKLSNRTSLSGRVATSSSGLITTNNITTLLCMETLCLPPMSPQQWDPWRYTPTVAVHRPQLLETLLWDGRLSTNLATKKTSTRGVTCRNTGLKNEPVGEALPPIFEYKHWKSAGRTFWKLHVQGFMYLSNRASIHVST